MRKRQRLVIVFILVVMLGCGALGFSAWTVGVNIFQSAGPPGSPTVNFVIKDGESTAQIGDDLQAQGLIRNALAFRLWARYKGLDRRLQAGAYPISASKTIPDIVDIFLSASPSEFWVTIPDGLRVWQIASKFAKTTELINFKSNAFVQIAQTGNYTDATTGKTVSLASQYWFLNHDQQDNTAPNFALEGYLFPDTYLVPLDASAADTIKLMLNDFGEKLCPGPDNKPDSYLN
ncbi:MAG TPA: endolytic transglycosylase MltG, partial [Ktedonobacterales bacterium]|nr:endolytic transglycosylase MltG [Ktedonobacterales bacterium]